MNGIPASIPFGAGPSNLIEAVSVRQSAMGTVAAALIAPWNTDGIQMHPLFSYSQSHTIPAAVVKIQKINIPTIGNPT